MVVVDNRMYISCFILASKHSFLYRVLNNFIHNLTIMKTESLVSYATPRPSPATLLWQTGGGMARCWCQPVHPLPLGLYLFCLGKGKDLMKVKAGYEKITRLDSYI